MLHEQLRYESTRGPCCLFLFTAFGCSILWYITVPTKKKKKPGK